MFEPPRAERPWTAAERAIVALFAGGIGFAFAAEIFAEFDPAKLAIPLMVLFWMPLLVLHEAGHALAAHAIGWRVDRVVLGYGKLRGKLRLGETEIELRTLPLEGFVETKPLVGPGRGLPRAWVYFAGPGIELVFAAAVFAASRALALEGIAAIAVDSLWLTAAAGAVLNLMPHGHYEADGRLLPSDGLGIWYALTNRIE